MPAFSRPRLLCFAAFQLPEINAELGTTSMGLINGINPNSPHIIPPNPLCYAEPCAEPFAVMDSVLIQHFYSFVLKQKNQKFKA